MRAKFARRRRVRNAWMAMCLAMCLGLLLHPAVAAACDHVGAYRVNLSQDAADLLDPNICTSKIIHSQIRQCIAQQISAAIADACKSNIDIYVPGTAAEHGARKQFNHLFRSDTDRAHLVLQYDDDRAAAARPGTSKNSRPTWSASPGRTTKSSTTSATV